MRLEREEHKEDRDRGVEARLVLRFCGPSFCATRARDVQLIAKRYFVACANNEMDARAIYSGK